jgi:RNA 2',3'-cyclic 3'-phosphodiesterase
MDRLFFACWPSEDAARALSRMARELAARLQGRPVPDGKAHLTLVFLGEVPAGRQDAALAAAESVRGEPFTMSLDRLGAFHHAGVAWAGASVPDPALLALQGALEEALRLRGFDLETRPYKPHVTLVRRVGSVFRGETIDPIAWRATDYALVRSEAGTGRYTTMKKFGMPAGAGIQTGSPPTRG